jgi:hypothetical protein
MSTQPVPATPNEIIALREGICARYRTYQQRDPDRFPDLPFNTNRANYEPLRESLEAEFFSVRGHDRNSPTIVIPSTSTLAALFTDDTYVPSRKILNTCQSYAEGATQPGALPNVPAPPPQRTRWVWVAGLALLLGLGAAVLGRGVWSEAAPSGLVITRPATNGLVPQEVAIEGRVANAKTVWVAVRSESDSLVYVQPPILVQPDGIWLGVMYIGSQKKDAGYTYQVRAFVNPTKPLQSGDMLINWPEAEFASGIIRVTREATRP